MKVIHNVTHSAISTVGTDLVLLVINEGTLVPP